MTYLKCVLLVQALTQLEEDGVNDETLSHLADGNMTGALVQTAKHAYELLDADSQRIANGKSTQQHIMDWWQKWLAS